MPSVILREDPQQLFGILDVRAAQQIKEQFERDAAKVTESQQLFWTELQIATDGDMAEYLAFLEGQRNAGG